MLALGLVELITRRDNAARAYNLERMLCNLVRIQEIVNLRVVDPAMQNYIKSPKRDVMKLVEYAHRFGIRKKIRNYIEILL